MLPTVTTDRVQLQSKVFCGFGAPGRLSILQVLRSGPMTALDSRWRQDTSR